MSNIRVVDSGIFYIDWRHSKYCTSWPWSKFLRSKFEIWKSQKWEELAQKCMIWHWYILISAIEWCNQCCTTWPWFQLSRSKMLNADIMETVRAKQKCVMQTFTKVGIHYRLELLQMLYSMTVTFIVKIKHILVKTCSCHYKMRKDSRCPRQICLDSHGTRRWVILV